MPNCNFNGCRVGSYYPRQIFTCSCLNQCSVGNIVNPVPPAEFGVFKLTTPVAVASGANIPVTVFDSSGTAVTDGGAGQINLTAGLYRISYNVVASIPAGGEVRTIFQIDGVDVTTTESIVSGSAGQIFSLSNQIVLNLTENSVLTLINQTAEAVTFQTANVSIDKLG